MTPQRKEQQAQALEDLLCRMENGGKLTLAEKFFLEQRLDKLPQERSAVPKEDEIGRLILDDQEKTIREYLKCC
ncbi:MAG: hypothetical protein EXS48_02735 [Candidatus Staskawiczbacteria bacterium]|nr:hypothetical protein [Candidatus Staskawiczbacteria bacterium]